jgi:hypothetical protein
MSDLPIPLTPADCDLQDFAFMPLDVARLRDSDLASDESPEACWAAVLLWSASWHQVPAASIPNNEMWIAKQAGYAQRGKIAKEWTDVRPGALRGWIHCTDGRLYHPVVAEKALDAWKSKLVQRWKSECARIKKHNQRHGTKFLTPDYDEWTNAGRPQGQPLPVPRDIPAAEEDNHGDKHSKGQGEGQGQGQLTSKTTTGTDTDDSTTVGANDDDVACHDIGKICIAMRGYGIKAAPGNQPMVEFAAQGVLLETLHAACKAAKARKPSEAVHANFVIGFIRNWATDAGTDMADTRPPKQQTSTSSKDQSRAAQMNSIGLGGHHHDQQPITIDADTGRVED